MPKEENVKLKCHVNNNTSPNMNKCSMIDNKARVLKIIKKISIYDGDMCVHSWSSSHLAVYRPNVGLLLCAAILYG